MSSRNPLGAQQRAQQRAPSGSTLQAHQRGISSSHLSPHSPVRKDGLADHGQLSDPADAATASSQASSAPSRHGATPRRAGASKLRLELSNEHGIISGPATDSPLGTPSIMSQSAAPDSSTDVSGNRSPALSRASHSDSAIPPMPMPHRRTSMQRFVASNKTAVPATAPVKRDSKPKQYTIEVPSAAPRYLSTNKHDTVHRDPFNKGLFSGNADFFPWTGRHHEDEWSTEAIQKGTWDRGSQNETSSARLAVYPSLKQKTGLNALSTIFMGVLNQRRNRGQVTTPGSPSRLPPAISPAGCSSRQCSHRLIILSRLLQHILTIFRRRAFRSGHHASLIKSRAATPTTTTINAAAPPTTLILAATSPSAFHSNSYAD